MGWIGLAVKGVTSIAGKFDKAQYRSEYADKLAELRANKDALIASAKQSSAKKLVAQKVAVQQQTQKKSNTKMIAIASSIGVVLIVGVILIKRR